MPAPTATDIEHAIEHPEPGQAGLLLDFAWFVPHLDGQWWRPAGDPKYPVYYLFTQPERMRPLREENERGRLHSLGLLPLTTEDGWNIPRPLPYQPVVDRLTLVPMTGREVFGTLAATGAVCEVHLNPLCGTYDRPHGWGCLRMAAGAVWDLAAGLDPHPETRVLPARSIAEIHLFMRYIHGVTDLTHRLEYIEGELAAAYEGPDIRQVLRRQAFTLVEALEDPLDLGPGASAILCGPTLASALDTQISSCEDLRDPELYQWLLSQAPAMLRQLDELLKMVDPATGEIGARFYRHPHSVSLVPPLRPHVLTEAWLRERRAGLEVFLRESASNPAGVAAS